MGDRKAWDEAAVTFDEAADHGLRDADCRAAWRALLVDALPPSPARVADLGCGTGTISRLLADEGHRVTGIDFSPAMVDRARAKSPDLEFAVGDAASPVLPSKSFDAVFSRHVLWALPDPEAVVRRWVELLAPGGRLVLVEGRWHTGAGLSPEACERLVRSVRTEAQVRRLEDPMLWGGPIHDERYLIVSRT